MENADGSEFALAGADAAFGSRTKNIFANLETIEAKHAAYESTPMARRESIALLKPDPGEDELASVVDSKPSFRVPICPPKKKCRPSVNAGGVPGYASDPAKWKVYDLSDVADSQLSETSNHGAALDFMQMRRSNADSEGKEEEDPAMTSSDSGACVRHVFRRPTHEASGNPGTCGGRKTLNRSAMRLCAGSEEQEENDGSGSADEVTCDTVKKTQVSKGGLVFNRNKSLQLRKRVRNTKAYDSDDDDDVNNADQERSDPSTDVAATAGEDSDGSDDFSELAEIEPDSDDDNEFADDDCYVSALGVVSGVKRRAGVALEHDENNGYLDGID